MVNLKPNAGISVFIEKFLPLQNAVWIFICADLCLCWPRYRMHLSPGVYAHAQKEKKKQHILCVCVHARTVQIVGLKILEN